MELFESYCFDCHDEDVQKGSVNMAELFDAGSFDGTLMFENLITAKMPPENKKQPNAEEKRAMLDWLANAKQTTSPPPTAGSAAMSLSIRSTICLESSST